MGVIGDTLSAARTRRAVDLEEVHAATGIRPRYLQAIEQEDWEALPEEFYARSFIRKYAEYLDVPSEPLVEEYRRRQGGGEGGGEAPTSPFARTSSRRAEALRRRRKRQGVYVWVGAAAVAVAIVVVIVLLVSGGGGGTKGGKGSGSQNGKSASGKAGANGRSGVHGTGKGGAGRGAGVTSQTSRRFFKTQVELAIEPTAEVWTCILNAKGEPLVDGRTLTAGETIGPFHSRSYTAAFGNGSVTVTVDGRATKTPDTPNPVGIAVDARGKVHELPEGERPSCE